MRIGPEMEREIVFFLQHGCSLFNWSNDASCEARQAILS